MEAAEGLSIVEQLRTKSTYLRCSLAHLCQHTCVVFGRQKLVHQWFVATMIKADRNVGGWGGGQCVCACVACCAFFRISAAYLISTHPEVLSLRYVYLR